MTCIWSSWCHCHPIVSCFSKIQNNLSFWCRPTQVVMEKRPLNELLSLLPRTLLRKCKQSKGALFFHLCEYAYVLWQPVRWQYPVVSLIQCTTVTDMNMHVCLWQPIRWQYPVVSHTQCTAVSDKHATSRLLDRALETNCTQCCTVDYTSHTRHVYLPCR